MGILNFNPELTDRRSLQTNQHSLERHEIDNHYVRGFTPGDFVLALTSAFVVVPAGDMMWPAIEMPDGSTSSAVVSVRKPSEWRTGKLRARLWFTSDVGSTNPFRIIVRVSAARDAEVLPSTTLLGVTNDLAGPAVANTVMRTDFIYATTSLGGDDELFALRVVRAGADAADTNVNDFQLLYVTLEHIPAIQEAT